MSDIILCELCGEPMPEGETMFKFHGYSGSCPKPPLPRDASESAARIRIALEDCYFYARRMLKGFKKKGHMDSEQAMAWSNIVRFCERAGLKPTILRANGVENE